MPQVPKITMQSEAAEYTVKLYKFADKCRKKIHSINTLVDSEKRSVP